MYEKIGHEAYVASLMPTTSITGKLWAGLSLQPPTSLQPISSNKTISLSSFPCHMLTQAVTIAVNGFAREGILADRRLRIQPPGSWGREDGVRTVRWWTTKRAWWQREGNLSMATRIRPHGWVGERDYLFYFDVGPTLRPPLRNKHCEKLQQTMSPILRPTLEINIEYALITSAGEGG